MAVLNCRSDKLYMAGSAEKQTGASQHTWTVIHSVWSGNRKRRELLNYMIIWRDKILEMTENEHLSAFLVILLALTISLNADSIHSAAYTHGALY